MRFLKKVKYKHLRRLNYNFLVNAIIICFILGCSKKKESFQKIIGDYYSNTNFEKHSFCPLYYSFTRDSVYIQYTGRSDKRRFKLRYYGLDSIIISDTIYNTKVNFFKRNNNWILVNKEESFILGKDTTKLFKVIETDRKNRDFKLKGYYYSENFFPNENKKENTFLNFTEDSVYIKSMFNDLDYGELRLLYTINKFGDIVTHNIDFIGGSSSYVIDHYMKNEVQMLTKYCSNKKFYVNLRKIDSSEFYNKKILEEKYKELESIKLPVELEEMKGNVVN